MTNSFKQVSTKFSSNQQSKRTTFTVNFISNSFMYNTCIDVENKYKFF